MDTKADIIQKALYSSSRPWPIIAILTGFAFAFVLVFFQSNRTPMPDWQFTTQAPISGGLSYSIPKRIPFAFDSTRIYTNDYNGHIYALNRKTGKAIWIFSTNDYSPYPPTVDPDGSVAIADFDSNIYFLNSATGREHWRFTIPGRFQPDTPAYITKTSVLFGARDGKLYALDKWSGHLQWTFTVGSPNFSSLTIGDPIVHFGMMTVSQNTVFINTPYHAFYILDAQTGELLQKVELHEYIQAAPIVQNETAYLKNKDNSYLAIDIQTGKIHTGNISPFTNDAFRLNEPNTSLDIAPSTLVDNGGMLFFASRDLRKIHAVSVRRLIQNQNLLSICCSLVNPKPITDVVNWLQAPMPIVVSHYQALRSFLAKLTNRELTSQPLAIVSNNPLVYELTLHYKDAAYKNPWEDVRLTADFTNESGTSYIVQGFYYDHDTWKVRFAPPTAGTWKWKTHFNTSVWILERQGVFLVPTSLVQKGFLAINKTHPYQLMYTNGSPFFGRGLEDVIKDFNYDGNPINQWASIDTAPTETRHLSFVDMNSYLRTYHDDGSGFNFFRFGVDNQSFRLWRTIAPDNNSYSINSGIWADQLMQSLRDNGYAVWMTVFGFDAPFPHNPTRSEFRAITRYIDYVVARYGAFVDIWELTNEASPSTTWVTDTATYIKSIDPYHHLVTTSWQRPDINTIDISSLHWYDSSPLTTVDAVTKFYLQSALREKKLVVVSEAGNKNTSWSPDSDVALRIKLWVSLFYHAPLIFWNQVRQYAKNPQNANIYIGRDELQAVRSFGKVVDELPGDLESFSVDVKAVGIRSYWLHDPHTIVGYLYHFDGAKKADCTFMVTLPRAAEITWYDPATGNTINTYRIGSGTQTIHSPSFGQDMAVIINF